MYYLQFLRLGEIQKQADEAVDVRRDPRCLHCRTTLNNVHHLYQRQLSLRHANRNTLQSYQRRRRTEYSHRISLHGRTTAVHWLRGWHYSPSFHPCGNAILRKRRSSGSSFTNVLVFRSRPRSTRLESPTTGQFPHSIRNAPVIVIHAHQSIQVDPRTSLPIRSILITTFVSLLLSLIILGSSTAFNDLVSLSVSGLQSSYLVAISLLLYRRSRGDISPPATSASFDSFPAAHANNHKSNSFRWGPWRVPGRWGTLNNTFACAYLTTVVFFSFWPTERPVTRENMNYAILMTGAVVWFSLVYYRVWARRVYVGPVVEVG